MDAAWREPAQLGDRIGHDVVDRRPLVDQPVDEGRVGAVLEQPAYQIGQQVLVAADRRVDPAGQAEPGRADHLAVERLAHPMQALELEIAARPGELEDRGQAERIVRGEHGIDRTAGRQHAAGAGDVVDVGRGLAREHRIAVEPALLGALDLGVPIGALDQPDHQPPAMPARHVLQMIEHGQRPGLVGLDRQAEAVPAAQCRIARQGLDQVKRQLEPIGLLGIDGEAHAVVPRGQGQRPHARQEFVQHPIALGRFIAWMQRGELDRDRRRVLDRAACDGRTDPVDGPAVALEIALGIGCGPGRLAQHVVGMAIADRLGRPGLGERLVDRPTHDELAAHDPHAGGNRLANDRLARARHQSADQPGRRRVRAQLDQAPGQHQRPGRGVDEERGGLADMPVPVGRTDLVADQAVDRLGIRDPQQGLGQTHQDDAFGRAQLVLVQKGIDAALAGTALAHRGDQAPRPVADPVELLGRECRIVQRALDRRRLVPPMSLADRRPQRSRRRRQRLEEHRWNQSSLKICLRMSLRRGGVRWWSMQVPFMADIQAGLNRGAAPCRP